MGEEAKKSEECADRCPFCALWAAYQKSESSEHVRAIQRESLLLARSLITAAIHATEEGLSSVEKKL